MSFVISRHTESPFQWHRPTQTCVPKPRVCTLQPRARTHTSTPIQFLQYTQYDTIQTVQIWIWSTSTFISLFFLFLPLSIFLFIRTFLFTLTCNNSLRHPQCLHENYMPHANQKLFWNKIYSHLSPCKNSTNNCLTIATVLQPPSTLFLTSL